MFETWKDKNNKPVDASVFNEVVEYHKEHSHLEDVQVVKGAGIRIDVKFDFDDAVTTEQKDKVHQEVINAVSEMYYQAHGQGLKRDPTRP